MNLIKLDAIDSTNTYLKQLASTGSLADEVVVVTSKQESGRGQLGAVWQSEPGNSLTCSLFKKLDKFQLADQARLNFAVSLALLEVLEHFKIPEVSVKWPNDIMSRQRKLAGILIENTVQKNQVTATVVGIGLNVNEASFRGLPQATSMFLAGGNVYDVDEVLHAVATSVFRALQHVSQQDTDALKDAYEQHLFRKGMVSTFLVEGTHKNGRILGVTENGLLRVAHDNDAVAEYGLREIRLLF